MKHLITQKNRACMAILFALLLFSGCKKDPFSKYPHDLTKKWKIEKHYLKGQLTKDKVKDYVLDLRSDGNYSLSCKYSHLGTGNYSAVKENGSFDYFMDKTQIQFAVLSSTTPIHSHIKIKTLTKDQFIFSTISNEEYHLKPY